MNLWSIFHRKEFLPEISQFKQSNECVRVWGRVLFKSHISYNECECGDIASALFRLMACQNKQLSRLSSAQNLKGKLANTTCPRCCLARTPPAPLPSSAALRTLLWIGLCVCWPWMWRRLNILSAVTGANHRRLMVPFQVRHLVSLQCMLGIRGSVIKTYNSAVFLEITIKSISGLIFYTFLVFYLKFWYP